MNRYRDCMGDVFPGIASTLPREELVGEKDSIQTRLRLVARFWEQPESTVTKVYYAQEKRADRIRRVGEILRRFYVPKKSQGKLYAKDKEQWLQELDEIYSKKRSFDKMNPSR